MTPAVLVSIVAASLLGSLHCAAMCGGFVAFYSGGVSVSAERRMLAHGAYHLGRLATYTALGAIAGAIGAAVDLAGAAAGVGRIAAFVAGGLLLVWGLALLLDAAGIRRPRLPLPRFFEARIAQAVSSLRDRPPIVRALLLGLSSTLLPCGWLYAFALSAAATGSAPLGALVMAAFWIGTIPLLLGLGIGLQSVLGRIRAHVPIISALVLMAVGMSAVIGRLNVPALAAAHVQSALTAPGGATDHPCCHHPH